ncbi:MAG: zinc-binding dehydrogenase [Corynebacterium sp.]|nr:zinc-binding dehydrogenase [Corynebacterium sp.]
MTSHLTLTGATHVNPQDVVLVHAGVGGLGSQFAQVARVLDASAIDVVVGSEEKVQLAQSLGYRNVYLRTELEKVPEGAYDIVVNPVGGEATNQGFCALRGGGRLLRVGNASQSEDVALSSMQHWLEELEQGRTTGKLAVAL